MQLLEVSGAVRPLYGSIGVKELRMIQQRWTQHAACAGKSESIGKAEDKTSRLQYSNVS
jgi:hypothetical protein